jgi:hypothetical protein
MKEKYSIFKNGGFPPIKYCSELDINKFPKKDSAKERLYINLPKQNINIRQLLTETIKKPIIITNQDTTDVLEEVTNL